MRRTCLLGWSLLVAAPAAGQSVGGAEALRRSIAHHDPAGRWASFSGTLILDEIRSNGSSREAAVSLDVGGGVFVYELREPTRVVKQVVGETCSAAVNGDATPTPAQVEEHRLECDQIKRSRNYYLYLWGLPMKLLDAGTRVEERVERTAFQGREVLQLRVTYDETVGSDIWYFYLDPGTYALVGYRFYHDESINDGEYITLDGEYAMAGMRIPQTRTWYRNDNNRRLGTDRLKDHRLP